MENNLVVRSASLVEQIEKKLKTNVENNQYYWYHQLKKIGKQAQTEQMVEEAVNNFIVDNHAYKILAVIAKKYLTPQICKNAVKRNGLNLKYVPEQYLNTKMCLIAVQNDGEALKVVPKKILFSKKGYELCLTAVRNDSKGNALSFVPDCYKRGKNGKILCEEAIRANEFALEYVPKKYMSEELVTSFVRRHPERLWHIPTEYISSDLCLELIEQNPRVILDIPAPLLTEELYREALLRDQTIPIKNVPKDICEKLEKEFCSKPFIKGKPIALETPPPVSEVKQIVPNVKKAHTYDLTTTGSSFIDTIYYITDIHLEHQLVKNPHDIVMLSLLEIQRRINDKITELLESVPNPQGTLLIGGDVADSIELEEQFYEQLKSRWRGEIFAVLGNHELWDRNSKGLKSMRSLDEIVADYHQALHYSVTLLENELFLHYKGTHKEKLDEQTILNTSIEELSEVCEKSTFILLGGTGFSGLNPVYNAKKGLYQATVSTEEDIMRSKRFRKVYEKVLASAENLPVIVLTHTPMADWSDAPYNPKWIYVSGHTHQNTLLLQDDGTAVFSDNQVGYNPKPWYLNSLTVDKHKYDPFKDYPDGTYPITREQYVEFNRGRSIMMQSVKSPGDLYALKRDGVYMFVLKSTSGMCLLEGSSRHKLGYDIDYYFDNLPEYIRKVRCALVPYQKALSMISEEVKAIGGVGKIHGCIVDIDWFNHVYLNPFDGKVTPYFAVDTTDKLIFNNIESLLKSSPFPPQLVDGTSMLVRYSSEAEKEKLPILSRNVNKKWDLAKGPQVILDRSIYKPSRNMRSIQYLFDQNVLRIWKDEVLSIEDKDEFNRLKTTEYTLDGNSRVDESHDK